MAIIESRYRAPLIYRNRHVATIIPSVYRKIEVSYERERLELSDGDFLDIDWLGKGRDNIIVLTHGLEGNSKRHYITGTAKYFYERGWGVAAWNCRSCSGEMNRLPRLYSHIDAPDLSQVVNHIAPSCSKIAIAGISMGGAITLNYLSKYHSHHPDNLIGAVAISAPINVETSSQTLEKPANKFYLNRFMSKMVERARKKEKQFPGLIDASGLDYVKSFSDYDVEYTPVLTNCSNISEFYQKANSIESLDSIHHPTLLIIAEDDPFMSKTCYPFDIARDHEFLDLEVPKHGGHTGFIMNNLSRSWMEHRTYEYIDNLLDKKF